MEKRERMGVRIPSSLPLQSIFLLKGSKINTTLPRIIKDYINTKLGETQTQNTRSREKRNNVKCLISPLSQMHVLELNSI